MRLKNWNTKPRWSRRKTVRSAGESRLRHVPATHTSPAVGTSMPAIRFSRVLLPLPLRPRIATISPSANATLVSRSTRLDSSPSR